MNLRENGKLATQEYSKSEWDLDKGEKSKRFFSLFCFGFCLCFNMKEMASLFVAI